jgi:hypothetical protein
MAKSKAKKMREKLVREGLSDPSIKRGGEYDFSLFTRKTKTKKELLDSRNNKKSFHDHANDDGDSFCIFLSFSISLV